MTATSLSDYDRYKALCHKAANDPLSFEVIRRHPDYMAIVESLGTEDGAEYAAFAMRNDPTIFDRAAELRRNDDFGGPFLCTYEPIGSFSPTTLRYVKVATDLRRLFGSLDGMRIAEIGGGYGGQCRILHALNEIGRYTIFDLEEPLALTRTYLSKFGIGDVRLTQLSAAEPDDYDLVISNYALSEIRTDLQDAYLEKAVLRSRHGYIIYNQEAFQKNHPNFSYRAEEIQERIPNAKIISGFPELPKADTKYNNVLIFW